MDLANIRKVSSFWIKLMAMVFMIIDHIGYVFYPAYITYPEYEVLRVIGRIAFPLFVFQMVEGYCHTHNFRKYLWRMFLFALVSEIPFNYMLSLEVTCPEYNNVLFTFCIGLIVLRVLDYARSKGTPWYLLALPVMAVIGYYAGNQLHVDYGGTAILMIIMFYALRDVRFGYLGMVVGMVLLVGVVMPFESGEILTSLDIGPYEITFGFEMPALLALIPIGLYSGEQGHHSKPFQYACYAFYPVHIAILAVASYFFYIA